jgi:hypothetical protein
VAEGKLAPMQFRLRTLLIVLGVLPPVLAGVWLLATNLPLAIPGLICFACFWLICGLMWLGIVRAFEGLLGERRK